MKKTFDKVHDFPPFFPPLLSQDHLLREELEILRIKYDKSEQDYQIMKRLYETKVDNEIELRTKNEALERNKYKLEHSNSFAILESARHRA